MPKPLKSLYLATKPRAQYFIHKKLLDLDGEIDPEHRSYHDDHSPYAIGRNHIKVYRGKSSPVKGHHDDHYGGDYYFAPWGYHATLTPDAHHKYGGYH